MKAKHCISLIPNKGIHGGKRLRALTVGYILSNLEFIKLVEKFKQKPRNSHLLFWFLTDDDSQIIATCN